MTPKTILAHADTEAHAASVIGLGIGLAKTFDAHLIGLHVVPDAFISAAVPPEVVGELLDAQRMANEEAAKRIKGVFDKTVAGASVSFEWQQAEARFETVASVVLRHGNAADVVVANQPEHSINLIDGIDTSEEVMLGLGRPVLIVPNSSSVSTIGKRVLLAWNGSRESARAAFDALPFLQQAESVRILSAARGKSGDDAAPTVGIEAALSRHGVRCSVVKAVSAPAEVGGALLSAAKEHDCDLIVMGGYGHWRFREIVFGGATRGVLEQTTIPVLMSH